MTDYVPVHLRSDNKCKQFPAKWWMNNANKTGGNQKKKEPTKDNQSAINLCRICPNQFDCLAENILIPHHIFGGTIADERTELRAKLEAENMIEHQMPGSSLLKLPKATYWKPLVSDEVLRTWLSLNWVTEYDTSKMVG